jgi:hypothetical protein
MDEMIASAEFLREARDRWFGGSTAVSVRTQAEAAGSAR